jgi:hypothetical protein
VNNLTKLFSVLSVFCISTYNAQVGIGTTSPQQRLHISGSDSGLQTIRIDDLAVTSGGTNPGEIASTTTTTSKALYADSNGDIKVRSVYGDNMQTVTLSSGSQNITSTSLTDITGASITFTPKHSTVFLSFAISGYNPLTSGGRPLSWFVVGVSNGSSNVGNFLSLSSATDDTTGSSGAATVSAANFPLTVTPGTPVTIKLRGRVGGLNHSDGFTINRTDYTSYMTILD